MSQALLLAKNTLPIPATDGLQAYLHRVNAIPLLTEEEERELANRFHQQEDLFAAQQLVLSHLRYVVKIARSYNGYGLALADLIQEGTIGLMKAVKRFDPTVGVRLVSFAVHWIKSEIHEYVIRNWRIVKVATTKAQRKLFFNLRQAKKRLGWFSTEEIQMVAQDLGVSTKEVIEMEKRLNAKDDSFDMPHSQEEESLTFSPVQYLPAPSEQEPEEAMLESNLEQWQHARLHVALESLDERSHDIVMQRWLNEENKVSLKDLAEKYQISIERVRQLEKVAMGKMQRYLTQESE